MATVETLSPKGAHAQRALGDVAANRPSLAPFARDVPVPAESSARSVCLERFGSRLPELDRTADDIVVILPRGRPQTPLGHRLMHTEPEHHSPEPTSQAQHVGSACATPLGHDRRSRRP
jgi:hypothetical protein